MLTSDSNLITLEVKGGGRGVRSHSSFHSKREASFAYTDIVSKENKQRNIRNNKNMKLSFFLSWRSNPGHWKRNLAVSCAISDAHIPFARVILCKLGWSGTRNLLVQPFTRNELSTTTHGRSGVLN